MSLLIDSLRRWIPPAVIDAAREIVAAPSAKPSPQAESEREGTANPGTVIPGFSKELIDQVASFLSSRCETVTSPAVGGDPIEFIYQAYFAWCSETEAKIYCDFSGFVMILVRNYLVPEMFLPEDGRVRMGVRVVLGRPALVMQQHPGFSFTPR